MTPISPDGSRATTSTRSLPEHRFDVAGLLVGSESTLVTVLHAELELLPVLKERALVVLGFPDIMKAADAVPDILLHKPIALEGMDDRLIHDEQIKRLNPIALEKLPEGKAFLMVQFGGNSRAEVDERAELMLHALGGSKHEATVGFLEQPEQEDELWRVREGGLGATAHVPGHPDTWEGWEDSAVSPDRLGDYLRDLEKLYEEFGYTDDAEPSLYGHFGHGCVWPGPLDLSYPDAASATPFLTLVTTSEAGSEKRARVQQQRLVRSPHSLGRQEIVGYRFSGSRGRLHITESTEP